MSFSVGSRLGPYQITAQIGRRRTSAFRRLLRFAKNRSANDFSPGRQYFAFTHQLGRGWTATTIDEIS
jgi:hypothetical protein